ncbi:hypothetical protein C8J56DRAFT_1157424 [Mycena floridula]|nr:hypothetical protein C8J56DRAFT_1157424 [Mycena floridula]
MNQIQSSEEAPALNEKQDLWINEIDEETNPVIDSAEYAYRRTNIVQVNHAGVDLAAHHIHEKLLSEKYTPRTWRTHALHICPNEPHISTDPWNKAMLNWIFLISALNFSFWSEKEGSPERYGVEWQEGWHSKDRKVWTGYWSLVAALNRALQDDELPITDPTFYASETLCPDVCIEQVFRPAAQCTETIPLLRERIAVMREVGFILSNSFGGSYQGFLEEFQRRHNGEGTALDLVKMVTETFPSFRDQVYLDGKKVCLWKRAQILVAETWAAFYPQSATAPHPIFPGPGGPKIHQLTMFADYRVPVILFHLKILSYPSSLIQTLQDGKPLEPGSNEEISLRAASIVAVERVREAMIKLNEGTSEPGNGVSSVLIDFFLWDLAKRVERGEEKIDGIETAASIPPHRTRSIWY